MLSIRARKSEHVLVVQWPLPTLRGADLTGHSLNYACLRGFDLRKAVFRGAHLRGADLSGSNLCGADLRGVDLRDALLTDAVFDEATRWPEGFRPEEAGARAIRTAEAWTPGPCEAEARRRGERLRSRDIRERAEHQCIAAEQLLQRACLVVERCRARSRRV